jgi:hypothetical protein
MTRGAAGLCVACGGKTRVLGAAEPVWDQEFYVITMHFQRFPANFGVEPRRPDMGGCKQVLNLQMDSCSPAPGGHFSVRPLSPFDTKCRRILYSKCFISRALAEEEQRCRPDEKGIETLHTVFT